MSRSPSLDFLHDRLLAGTDFEVAGSDLAAGVGYRITARRGELETAPFSRIAFAALKEAVEGSLPVSVGATIYRVEASFGPSFLKAARGASRITALCVTVQSPLRVECVIGSSVEALVEALANVLPARLEVSPDTLAEGSREVGRKVGHAAKDLAGLREAAFSLEHLETLERSGEAEAYEAVRKDVIWPAPNVESLRAQGVPPAVAFGVVSVWRMLKQRPARNPAARLAFVRDVPAIRGALEGCRTVDEFTAAARAQVTRLGRQADEVLGSRLPSFAERLRYGSSSFFARRDSVLQDLLDINAVKGDKAQWERVSKALAGKAVERKPAGLPLPERTSLPLDQLKREGAGLPVIPPAERIPEEHGITGLEFGNYVSRREGESLARHLSGALADLRQLLGDWIVPLFRAGNLSLALGARGKGQACAHYEPALRVINLTKGKGDGSLAHEVAHFIDHMLADHADGESRYLSARVKKAKHKAHPVAAAMAAVMASISASSFRERVNGEVEPRRWYLQRWMKKSGFDPALPAQESFDRIADKFPDSFRGGREPRENAVMLAHSLAKFSGAPVDVEIAYEGPSAFAAEAKKLGAYWSRPEELFARAFESFIEDEAARRGWVSQYLVAGTRADYSRCRGLPYPIGAERERIATAMRALMASCAGEGAQRRRGRNRPG